VSIWDGDEYWGTIKCIKVYEYRIEWFVGNEKKSVINADINSLKKQVEDGGYKPGYERHIAVIGEISW
jgi:hypothetical protein